MHEEPDFYIFYELSTRHFKSFTMQQLWDMDLTGLRFVTFGWREE